MNRSLRKSSRYLIFPILFVATIAFAYELFLPHFQSQQKPSFLPDSTNTKQTQSSDSIYQKLLGSISDLFNQQRYEECLVLLKKANTLNPNVLSILERMIRVEGLIAQQKKTLEEYTRLITMADAYFAKKDYLNAKASYQLAIDTKPNDAYAKERMNTTMELLRSNKAQNILYDVTLASADKLFTAGEYDKAKSQYENACSILPGEAYPKEKINAIIKILVDQQVREELYLQAITSADNFYTSRSFQRALLEYQKALQQKPAEPYPQQRITDLTKILADLAALDKAYKDAIARADQLFSEIRYPDARTGYEEALGLKPKEAYPAQKISEIDGILARITKDNADFERFVNLADSFYMDKNFIRARQNYQLALQIKPNESYPKAMLAKTTEGVGSQQANQMAMEEAYNAAISNADRLFADQALPEAKSEYENALAIKPEESYPAGKIKEIDALLARIALAEKLDADYSLAIVRGDSLLETKAYQQAKGAFQTASSLKPKESYPIIKITEIDGILAEGTRLQTLNQQYDEIIARGDQLFGQSAWQQARGVYVQALSLKPEEPYPAQQMVKIDKKLEEIAQLNALNREYQETIATAEKYFSSAAYDSARNTFIAAQNLKPAETLPGMRIAQIDSILTLFADQKALDERYAELISSSDKLLASEDYQSARAGYTQAMALKPSEKYPGTKVVEIDGILAEKERVAALELQYAMAIAQGDSLISANRLIPARGEFETASALKPGEAYPKEKLAYIETALQKIASQQALETQYLDEVASADKLFAEKRWDPAIAGYRRALDMKPSEDYPARKINEIDSIKQEEARLLALNQEYQKTIATGERQFKGTAYDSARITFANAQSLKPDEPLPSERIAQIDSILLAIANQKALDKEYTALIASSDKLIAQKEYSAAREGYTQALALKPTEAYPAAKVSEIDAILAENARIAALEAQYSKAIANGDSLLSAVLLTAARVQFEVASGLKPGETYPKTKLAEIDAELQDIARLQVLDKRYREEVATADGLFSDKSWDPAVAAYKRALELKPAEKYPGQKIAEIDSIKLEIERQIKIDSDYNTLIARGDQFFSIRVLDSARMVYVRAGELRPEKSYSQEQIAEIDRIQAEINRVNEEYQATITSADQLLSQQRYEDARVAFQDASLIKPSETYPREKIKEINHKLAEIQGLRLTFDKLVSNGDQFFSDKQYFKAKENFGQALDLFPGEEYPKEKLRITNVKIDSIYRANKADYDNAVGEGNGFFNTYEYDKAIDAFSRALAFLPNEDYPRQMIAKIRKTIFENAIADVLKTTVVIKAGEEHKFPFEPVNISSRRNNFIYLKVKNLSDNSFNILIRYGKGDQTSGGLAIRNISADGEVNERLISVKDQDPWYREDNNWISLYPQGGDIEVSFIQVSRAIK